MVIAIMGESCVGKTTLAKQLAEKTDAKIFSGNDWLRLAKGADEARVRFRELLATSQDTVIYLISEKDQLDLLPDECFRVLVTAELDVIKQRFAKRTGGNLPPPLAAMLERKHGMFDSVSHDIHLSDETDGCERILAAIRQ